MTVITKKRAKKKRIRVIPNRLTLAINAKDTAVYFSLYPYKQERQDERRKNEKR